MLLVMLLPCIRKLLPRVLCYDFAMHLPCLCRAMIVVAMSLPFPVCLPCFCNVFGNVFGNPFAVLLQCPLPCFCDELAMFWLCFCRRCFCHGFAMLLPSVLPLFCKASCHAFGHVFAVLHGKAWQRHAQGTAKAWQRHGKSIPEALQPQALQQHGKTMATASQNYG